MKRLILIRHAKSSWSNATIPDNERPLNERGLGATRKVGQWMKAKGYMPDEVISSNATRCAETWAGVAETLGCDVGATFDAGLYLAGPETMLAALHSARGDVVAMLGHMPGIGSFARDLRRDPPPMHASFQKYPTAAVTVLDFKADDWREVQMGTGKFIDFGIPREM